MRRAVIGLAMVGILGQGHRLSAQTAYEQLQTFSGVNQIRQNYVDSIGSGDRRVRFTGNPDAWQARLVNPFLTRVRIRLQVAGQIDSLVTQRIGRILADRVVEVRWGPEARDQFLLQNDADVTAAMGYFPRCWSS